MEDDTGLELSLGLSCGGSFSKLKGKNNSLDVRADECDKLDKRVDNFLNNFSMAESDSFTRGLWALHDRSFQAEEENFGQNECGGKRKLLFNELNHSKKQEKETHFMPAPENEGVSESEVDGSSSRLDSNVVNLNTLNRLSVPLETDCNIGKITYGVPLADYPFNMNVSYSLPLKECNNPGYALSGLNQLTPSVDRNESHTLNSGNLPLAFGYSPIQLPILDKEHNFRFGLSPQQLLPRYVGKASDSTTINADSNNGLNIARVSGHLPPIITTSEAKLYQGMAVEVTKQEGFPSHTEEGGGKGNNVTPNFNPKDSSGQITEEATSHEGSIRPGIAANLKFGGSGSSPKLPWVSTTGPGPNGKTISGVTYRFSRNQIKIVCACHGAHMTPEQFVQHADEEHVATDVPFPTSNPAASAQS